MLRFDVGSSRRRESLRGRDERVEGDPWSVSKEEAEEKDMMDRGRGRAEPRERIAARRAWLSRPVSRGRDTVRPPKTSADDVECLRARRVSTSSPPSVSGPTPLIRSRPQSHQDWSALDACLCSPAELRSSLKAGDGARSDGVGEAAPPQSDQASEPLRGTAAPPKEASLALRPMSTEDGPIWRDDKLPPIGGVFSADDSLEGRWWRE